MGNHQKHAEINALAPIPKSERQNWISLALVQAGICVCASSFLEGALLAEAMPLGEAILAGSLGNLLVVIFMTIIGFAGSDLGLASCTLSESCFGKSGARYLVSVVFAINLVGWFGITNEICGDAFTNFMGETFGIHIPLVASNILWGLIMLITAVYGMKAMEKTQCRLDSVPASRHGRRYLAGYPGIRTRRRLFRCGENHEFHGRCQPRL